MRRDRIMVTVSPEMRAALHLLARRAGISEATQATITLRQALDRTIGTDECRQMLARQEAFTTVKEWREARAADVYVARLTGEGTAYDATPQTTAHLPAAPSPAPRRGTRKVHHVAGPADGASLVPQDDDPPWSNPAVTGGY